MGWSRDDRQWLQAILDDCDFGDWSFTVGGDPDHFLYLQVGFDAECARAGIDTFCKGRKWLISPHMTKSEIVQTAFKACLTAMEHEAREDFRYRGEPVFAPHFDVERLVELSKDPEAQDARVLP